MRSVELYLKAERVFPLLCYTELVIIPGVKSVNLMSLRFLGAVSWQEERVGQREWFCLSREE